MGVFLCLLLTLVHKYYIISSEYKREKGGLYEPGYQEIND